MEINNNVTIQFQWGRIQKESKTVTFPISFHHVRSCCLTHTYLNDTGLTPSVFEIISANGTQIKVNAINMKTSQLIDTATCYIISIGY